MNPATRLACRALVTSGFADHCMQERKSGRRPALTILNYHRVVTPEQAAGLDSRMISATPEGFEWQMAYLQQHFDLLAPEEIVLRLTLGHDLPPNAALVTFDDGYRDNFDIAYPILQRRSIPAVVFLITGLIGTHERMWWDEVAALVSSTKVEQAAFSEVGDLYFRNPLERNQSRERLRQLLKSQPEGRRQETLDDLHQKLNGIPVVKPLDRLFLNWDEVREMRWGGISFGAHTHTHPILTHMPEDRAAWEMGVSKQIVERELGQEVPWFAYPNGRRGDFNLHTRRLLESTGFSLALTLMHGVNAPKEMDRLALRRMYIGTDDRQVFVAKVSGALERLISRSSFLRDRVDGR